MRISDWSSDVCSSDLRSDNRLKNLRAVSIQQNRRNMRRPRRNTSGCLGVSRNPGSSTWRARIKVNGKEVHLGSFKTKSEAAAARKAADRLHGYPPNHGRSSEERRGGK